MIKSPLFSNCKFFELPPPPNLDGHLSLKRESCLDGVGGGEEGGGGEFKRGGELFRGFGEGKGGINWFR
jgi:hypothetical protein